MSTCSAKKTSGETKKKNDDIKYGTLIQLECGISNFEQVLALYPADCDFAKKTSGLEKDEHEATVALEAEEPNARNTFFVRRGRGTLINKKKKNKLDCDYDDNLMMNKKKLAIKDEGEDKNEQELVRFGERIIISANPMLFELEDDDDDDDDVKNTTTMDEKRKRLKDLVCSTVSNQYNEYLYGGRRNGSSSRKVFTVFRESTLARENEFEIVPWQSVTERISSRNIGSHSSDQINNLPVKTSDAFLLRHCGRGGYLRCLNENWSTPDFGIVSPVVSDENEASLTKRRFDTSYLWRFSNL
jgi:hypothetical protein